MFKDEVVIITGGTSGIGKVTAKLFLKEEAKVVITGRNANRGEIAVAELKKVNKDIEYIQMDISEAGDAENLVNNTFRYMG